MNSKKELRIQAKKIRKNLDIKLISQKLVDLIRQADIYKSADNVLIYYPKENEIDLLDLLNDDKKFYLPKIDGNNLLICPFSQELSISKFNTLEPCTDAVSSNILDLAIVPALMADKCGNRLGYGGGFYDRFLNANSIPSIVALPKELIIEKLPCETHDVKIDYIIQK